jgi:hypothetical protein
VNFGPTIINNLVLKESWRSSFSLAVNKTLASPSHTNSLGINADVFVQEFQRALTACIKRGFTVDEAFGFIWSETIEQVRLSQHEEARLQPELMQWASRTVQEQSCHRLANASASHANNCRTG